MRIKAGRPSCAGRKTSVKTGTLNLGDSSGDG